MRRWTRAALPTLILSSLAALMWARGSESLPLYATRTGLLCASCHFDPNGGGPRNELASRSRATVIASSPRTPPASGTI